MEASISQLKTVHQFRTLTPKTRFSCLPIVSVPFEDKQLKRRAIKCGKEAEKVTAEKEVNTEEEVIAMMKLNEKCCGESGGIIELMECLEREAIMGEDEGREATDYNRRALIFDRSSRVFQALKQQSP